MATQTTVLSGPELAAQVNDRFQDQWDTKREELMKSLDGIVHLDTTSTHLVETYAHRTSAPHPVRWDTKREEMPADGSDALSFTVENFDFAKRVLWDKNNREDSMIEDPLIHAGQLGANFGLLPLRFLTQYITGASDPDLMPAVPTTPSGQAIFATSVYGVAAGNIVSGAGVATTAAVQGDIYTGISRVPQFQDTHGQPLFDMSIFNGEVVIMFPPSLMEVMTAALIQPRVVEGSSTPSNIVLSGPAKFRSFVNPYLSGDDYYMFFTGTQQRGFFQQNRMPLEAEFFTGGGGDSGLHVRNQEQVAYRTRLGFGVRETFQCIKIDN